jgi:hypothetical protein
MNTVYLHIGTHKTGSTAVQAFAARFQGDLQARGLLYPEAGRPRVKRFASGHHLLPWSRMEHVNWKPAWGDRAAEPVRVWDDLREELERSACDRALISTEEFDVLDDEGVGFVAHRLEGLDVEVICYLRRLDEFLQSYYATEVLYHGETRDLDAYMQDTRTTLDHFELVERWRRHFGQANVRIGFYAKSGLRNGDIVADLFEQAGIDVAGIGDTKRARFVNWGAPSAQTIETIRRLNERRAPSTLVRAAVIAARLLPVGSRFDLLTETQRKELVEYGLERIRLLGAEAFTPEVEYAFRWLP